MSDAGNNPVAVGKTVNASDALTVLNRGSRMGREMPTCGNIARFMTKTADR